MNIGLAIEECRKLKGVTKSALAKSAQLSLPYFSQIVSGQREPPLSTIEKIAKALGLPSSLLILLASENSELSVLSEELLDEIRSVCKSVIETNAKEVSDPKIFGRDC